MVKDVMGKFSGLGIEARIREYKVVKAWENAVGGHIAKKARPVRLIGKTLHCVVSSSAWMSELNYQKKLITGKINRILGEDALEGLVFKSGTVPSPVRAPEKPPVRHRPPTPEEKHRIERTVEPVKDPDLKALIRRAMAKAVTEE